MKYALIFLTMFLTNAIAKAENCTEETSAAQVEETTEIKTDVPNHLKGAKIVVRLADGRESVVPAEKFKVVPRLQQYLVTKVSKNTVRSCTVVDSKKHRLSGLIGHGPTGHLDRSSDASKAVVESDNGVMGGIQYQYRFTDRVSGAVQVQGTDFSRDNKTGLIGVGYDF